MYIQSIDALLDQLAVAIAVGGTYEAPKVCLYTNDAYPTRDKVLADFEIENFGGLTNQKAVTWGAPFLNANSQAEVLGGISTWVTTALTALPVTAYGVLILNTAGTAWLLGERFAEPQAFNAIGNSLSVVPRLVLDT